MLVRSTSLATFKACPRKAYYRYHLGLVRKGSNNTDTGFGKAVHLGIETYHKTGSLAVAIEQCQTIVFPPNKNKNMQSAVALLHVYAAGNKISMIDLEVKFEKPFGKHIWRGTVDGRGVYLVDNRIYIIEHKTTNPRYLQYKPNDQFIGYFYIMRDEFEDLAGILVNNLNPEKIEVIRSPVIYSDAELAQWYDETTQVLDYYDSCLRNDSFPRNPGSCFDYNRQCSFFELCQDGLHNRALIGALFDESTEAKELSW